ncbi:hypothetical protein BDN72DRAFT_134981 [Pluteus cervinus]|uniref:Uncharacterized protein n=1 Tax=Pluteus cervinus TaxID=181527 RepID=A0ACD3B763_9AGAR|nr:hypothetical protein BDN72DRAFT_134981 [Pluteus cervinus]
MPSIAQNLPADILSVVFRFVYESAMQDPVRFPPAWSLRLVDQPNVNGFPWTLTRVCSHWRSSAQTTWNLWSHIALHLRNENDLNKFTDFLATYHIGAAHLLTLTKSVVACDLTTLT